MKKNHYNRKIDMKFIRISIERNFVLILTFFALFLSIGEIYTNNFYKSYFISTAQITSNKAINFRSINTMKEVLKAQDTINNVVDLLDKNNVRYANDSKITGDDILNGIKMPTDNTSMIFNISFTNSDSSIIQTTLDQFLEVYLSDLKLINYDEFSILKINKHASEPSKVNDGISPIVYFAFGGFLLAIIISVFKEIESDLLFCNEDIEILGIRTYEFDYKIENNLSNNANENNLLSEGLIDMHNDINTIADSKVIALVSPSNSINSGIVAKAYGELNSLLNKKVIIIDCNFNNPVINVVFNSNNDVSINALIDKGINEIIIPYNRNLDLVFATPSNYSSDIFKLQRFIDFINTIKKEYDQVILNVSPLLLCDDLMLLKDIVTAVIIATKQYETKREDLFNCFNKIQESDLPLVGTVYIK